MWASGAPLQEGSEPEDDDDDDDAAGSAGAERHSSNSSVGSHPLKQTQNHASEGAAGEAAAAVDGEEDANLVPEVCALRGHPSGRPRVKQLRRAAQRRPALSFTAEPRSAPSHSQVRYVTIPLPVGGGKSFEFTVDGSRLTFTAPAKAAAGEEHEYTFIALRDESGAVSLPTRYVEIGLPVEGGRAFDWKVDGVEHSLTAPKAARRGDSHRYTFPRIATAEQVADSKAAVAVANLAEATAAAEAAAAQVAADEANHASGGAADGSEQPDEGATIAQPTEVRLVKALATTRIGLTLYRHDPQPPLPAESTSAHIAAYAAACAAAEAAAADDAASASSDTAGGGGAADEAITGAVVSKLDTDGLAAQSGALQLGMRILAVQGVPVGIHSCAPR